MKSGFEYRRLGSAVTLVMGQAPASSDCNRNGIGTPFVKVGEFGIERPVIREWTTDPRKMARTTDVLICVVGATCGKINLGADCAIGRSVAAIRPKVDVIEQRYLWYFMQGKVQEMRQGSQGAAQTVINREMISDLLIPLPPLDEQHRIVAVLDKAFAGIATATMNAQKNLTNARSLFEGFLKSVFATEADGWQSKTLAQTCKMYQPKTISAKELVPDGPYSVFGANGIIGLYDKFNHAEPQLLITCRGATCGSVNVSLPNSWITGNAMVVRPLDGSIDLKFLEFFFRGGVDISQVITGAAQPQITRANLETLEFHFPTDICEQRKIAHVATNLMEYVEKLEAIIDDKVMALNELKQSLLQKAFAGELT